MFEFIAYSDIHHDKYSNGITLDDSISVEHRITEFAKARGITCVLFAGDWFRATNPLKAVVSAAEETWKQRSDAGITTLVMPGNHDRETRLATSAHVYQSANIFRTDLKNVIVYDKVQELILPSPYSDVRFLFVPALHEGQDLPKSDLHTIIVFHALITGSSLLGRHGAQGIDPDIFRSLNPALVIGGDNHTPQQLGSILGCPSFYCGAPLQHTWGDRDQERGFWHVKMSGKNVQYELIPMDTPRFTRMTISAKNEVDVFCDVAEELKHCRPAILDLTLVGGEGIDIEGLDLALRRGFNLRQLKISIDRTLDRVTLAPGISDAKTPEDKWDTFVSAGLAPGMDVLEPKFLSEIGRWAIQEAKRIQ